jgi:hypothetical protein
MTLEQDALDFKPDGTVYLEWAGLEAGSVHRRTLRRPRLGEYRRTIERMTTLTEAVRSGSGRSDSFDTGVEATLEWLRGVFELLGDQGLPEVADECPAWLVSVDFARDLVAHWQTLPSRPGGA